jgi:hypothetical protein
MKLIGIEFQDYAGFSKQFVPLRQGLNVLVGKNNAGKTALLRGVSLVNEIAGRGGPRFGEPEQYCLAMANGGRFLIFRLLFLLTEDDGRQFQWSEETVNMFVKECHALLAVESFWQPGATSFFGQCDVVVADKSFPLLVSQNQQLTFNRISQNQQLTFTPLDGFEAIPQRQIETNERFDHAGRSYYVPRHRS